MKIGYDAKRALHNKTGLGQYSRWMLEFASQEKLFDKVYLFDPFRTSKFQPPKHPKFELVSGGAHSKVYGALWRSFLCTGVPAFDALDIYHGLSGEIPFTIKQKKCIKITTVHDLLFLHLPQQYSVLDRKIYTSKTRQLIRNSDHIIAVSNQTKRDLVELMDAPSKKVSVVHQSCHPQFKPLPPSQPKERYVLSLGGIEERKNHELAINSFAKMPRLDLKLVIAGRLTQHKKKLEALCSKHSLTGRVRFVENYEFQDLPGLIHHAAACMYLSRWEGFGIPILECISMGKMILLSNVPYAREVAGEAGVYVNDNSADELCEKLLWYLDHDGARKEKEQQCLTRSRDFKDSNLFPKITKVYQNLIS